MSHDDQAPEPPATTTPAAEVLAVVGMLAALGVVHQVNGGWGVDALVGRQTRPHRDLDVFVDADAVPGLLAWLEARGYARVDDWLPVRIEPAGPRGRVEVHPMTLDAAGNGLQAGLGGEVFRHPVAQRTTGRIDGRPVVVATRERLLELRHGCPPRPEDVHDIGLLQQLGAQAEQTAAGREPHARRVRT